LDLKIAKNKCINKTFGDHTLMQKNRNGEWKKSYVKNRLSKVPFGKIGAWFMSKILPINLNKHIFWKTLNPKELFPPSEVLWGEKKDFDPTKFKNRL
jgi:hypothetical protein